MREIYLVRHAIAEERGAAWPDDGLRPLTREGIRRFTDVVRGLDALDVELDLILTSPLIRAQQTADVLSSGLRGHPPIKILKALAPGTPPAQVMTTTSPSRRRVALVGHEPDLGGLAAFLIGARRPLPFRKGGVCRIDVPEGTARPGGLLIWFATPRLLRRVARA
jgi:phosphohistidine phosphatase